MYVLYLHTPCSIYIYTHCNVFFFEFCICYLLDLYYYFFLVVFLLLFIIIVVAFWPAVASSFLAFSSFPGNLAFQHSISIPAF